MWWQKEIKLIFHTGEIDIADDPSFGPWKLYVNLRPPEFMQMAFICMTGGSEEVVCRGKSKEALEEFVKAADLNNHPRLRRMTIEES